MPEKLLIEPLPKQPVVDGIDLPLSKSVLNRYLCMELLQNGTLTQLPAYSLADDVVLMHNVLQKLSNHQSDQSGEPVVLDCHNAGTVARFAAVMAASLGIKAIVKGDPRLHQRPVAELGEMLKSVGFDLEWIGQKGFLPLLINGGRCSVDTLRVKATESSQHISACLLVAPFLGRELVVEWSEDIVSWPYVELTIKMMQQSGARASLQPKSVVISPGGYPYLKPFWVRDWSSAAFMLQAATMMPVGSTIPLRRLTRNQLQGDEIAEELFAPLGVTLQNHPEGLMAIKRSTPDPVVKADFTHCPDLFNTFAMAVAMLNLSGVLRCPKHLRYKESNRLGDFLETLARNGFQVDLKGDELLIEPRNSPLPNPLLCNSMNDHRIAMSWAIAGIKHPVLLINPDVVSKSFPGFFSQLEKVASLTTCNHR